VRTLSNGDLMLAGLDSGSPTRGYLVRIDASGEVKWARSLHQQYDDNGAEPGGTTLDALSEVFDVVEGKDGFTVVGTAYGAFELPAMNAAGFFAGWVAELDSDGGKRTSTIYRTEAEAQGTRLFAAAARATGSPLLVGESIVTIGDSKADVLLMQGSTTRLLTTSGEDVAYVHGASGGGRPLIPTRDGGFFLAVTTDGLGGQDALWVMKLGRTADALLGGGAVVSTEGLSFENPLLTSTSSSVTPTDLAVTPLEVTAQVQTEDTGVREGAQAK
jgi:hypothetical protein